MLLKGKKILVTGVANDWSMAWAIAKRAHEMGAEIAMPYAMPALEKRAKLRFYLSGHNLLTIKSKSLTCKDPENPNWAYPLATSVTFGVQVGF